MRFFAFLESRFTYHSITNQADNFSALADGEQKATQSFLSLVRYLSKLWAFIKLPVHFWLCKMRILEFPEPAKVMMERAIKEGQERALKLKEAHANQGKSEPSQRALGLAKAPTDAS